MDLFDRPTSVIICGADRSLNNWVALGLVAAADHFWTEVRLPGQAADAVDPVGLGAIGDDRRHLVTPDEMTRNDSVSNVALAGVVRSDEPPAAVQRIVDFLRLPTHTQRLIAAHQPGDRPFVLVLANAHRIVSMYPAETVRPILRSILDAGFSVLLTVADAPPAGRFLFDHALAVTGQPVQWREAELRVEKGGPSGAFAQDRRDPLTAWPVLAEFLARTLDPHLPPAHIAGPR